MTPTPTRDLMALSISEILQRARNVPFRKWDCWHDVQRSCESLHRMARAVAIDIPAPPQLRGEEHTPCKRKLVLWLLGGLFECCPHLSQSEKADVSQTILQDPSLRICIFQPPSPVHIREATRYLAHSYTFPGMPWFDPVLDIAGDDADYETHYPSADAEERYAFATRLQMEGTVVFRLGVDSVCGTTRPMADIAVVRHPAGKVEVFAWPLHRRLERTALSRPVPETPCVSSRFDGVPRPRVRG